MSAKKMFMICLILCVVFSLQMACASEVDDGILIQNSTCADGNNISSDSLTSSQNLLRAGDEGSFTDLAGELIGGGTVTLRKNYTYVIGSDDYEEGIPISADTTIIAEGNIVINARNQARIFNIADGASVILNGITFVGGHSSGNGGAIYTQGSLTAVGCIFRGNTADNGGAIYYGNAQSGSITGSTFIGNEATDGGAVYTTAESFEVIGSRFIGNGAAGKGGAIMWACDEGTLMHTNMTGNHAADGGALYMQGSDGTVNDLMCLGNIATNNGGSAYVAGSNYKITFSNFTASNATKNGGALYITGDYVNVTHSTLDKCSALEENGGAIYASGINVTISDSNFTMNRINFKTGLGGSIDIEGDGAKILNSIFDRCSAWDGGVVYVNGSYVTIDGYSCNRSFANNSGGAIYVLGDHVTISNFNISNTNATNDGGAIYVEGDFANIVNSNFTRCISDYGNGAALYINGLNATVFKSNFVQNRVNVRNGREGGSIYIEGDGARILSTTFMMCTAYEGGVAYVQGSDVTIDDVVCERSFASNGGAFYIAGDNVVMVALFILPVIM